MLLASPARHASILLIALLVVPLAEFALTPVWRWSGAYRYHSRLLFTIARRANSLELHTGTGYDFAAHAWRTRARLLPSRHAVVLEIVHGLLALIGEIEAGRISPQTRISATSYFFSDSTARRLGFLLCPTPPAERMHLLLNLLTSLVTYSYVQGHCTLPPVWKAKTAVTSAGALARQKPRLQRLAGRLERGPVGAALDVRLRTHQC